MTIRDGLMVTDIRQGALSSDPCAHRRGRVVRATLAVYRWLLSPLLVALVGPACRFEPTCSRYAEEAIAHYGTVCGGWLAVKRLLRCRPGGGWGYDPVVICRPTAANESGAACSPMPPSDASGVAGS